ncbi:thioesterase family protein [Nocardioidaceae bacterium]|nr:thioesterase family protein [Nocardioidaceae bacterium]
MSEYDDLTRVRRTDGATGEGGERATYVGALGDAWSIGAAVNGGAVLSVIGAALSDLFGDRHPDPLSVSAVYLAPGTDGPCDITIDVHRRGGRTSVASATLSQDGTEKVRVLATYTDLDLWTGETHLAGEQPAIPSPEDCFGRESAPDGGPEQPPLTHRLDLRFDPACIGWAVGKPSGQGMLQAQIALADGRDWDAVSLLLAADALVPTTFDLGIPGWAPTVELTVHVRAKPAPGHLHVRHATRFMTGGLFEEDAEVWDSAGTLVAQARQLAMVPKDAR